MSRNRNKLSILFIHTPCPELDEDRLEPPLGILYLATILSRDGYDCRVCDLSGIKEENWNACLTHADVYAFSTYSVNFHLTKKIARMVKMINPDATLIAGGPHVSAEPVDSKRFFDVVITSEAEYRMQEVMHALSIGRKFHHSVYHGHTLTNLDDLPFPDYDLVDMDSYCRQLGGEKSISLITSRGCPFNCTFCNSRIFIRGQTRLRTPQNVVAEIRALKAKYNINAFRFGDDLFTLTPERTIEMCRVLRPLDIKYRIFARSSSMTPMACKALYESGCRHVAMGIESMSPRMLKELNKRNTTEQNREGMANAKKAGLRVRIYLLIGFPGETEDTFQESLSNLMTCDFDEFIIYPFIPYPGTAIWIDSEAWNCKIDKDVSTYVQVGKGRKTCYPVTMLDGSFDPQKVEEWRTRMIGELEKIAVWP